MNATSPVRGFDWLTVMAISALAYIIGTALHEHAGHALACVALGGHVQKFGAFYVDCDYRQMGSLGVRWVAIAGPVTSLLLGLVSARILHGVHSPLAKLFWWLLASIGCMTAFGYMLFSAVGGIGDLGIEKDGALHALPMPWVLRIAMGVIGYWLYDRVVVWSITRLGGITGGDDRVRRVRRIALFCYIAGGFASVVIGLFNPEGLIIVLISAAAASLGGTSGFAWGPSRTRLTDDPSIAATVFPRSWTWIVVSAVVVLTYGVVFGPTILN